MLNTPLLALVVVAYNVIVFLTGPELTAPVLSQPLPSGAVWTLTVGDLLVATGLVLLYVEILKSTRATVASVIDHALSMAVFVVCLLELVLVARCGTDTFFLITLLTLFDVISGFTVSISTARRDIGVGERIR
jgi:hypothetical protein